MATQLTVTPRMSRPRYSFVSTESGDQLELGTDQTDVVQGSQQLFPHHDAWKDGPQGGRNKVLGSDDAR